MHSTYSHIDLDERRKIALWRSAKLSVDVIAEKLGRHRSTSCRSKLLEECNRSATCLRQPRSVIDGVIKIPSPLLRIVRSSITFDRGTEFSECVHLQTGMGSQDHGCDPHKWSTATDEHDAGFPWAFIRSPLSGKLQFEL